MSAEFEIRREVELPATAEQVFAAVTTGPAGWMFPVGEIEPREGGAGPFGGVVTGWQPPGLFAIRMEGPDGWFNALEYVIEARDGGTAVLRYVHSGIFTDDWDNQYDGAGQHTDFYLHTLSEYLQHFAGRSVVYTEANAPAESSSSNGFDKLRSALGVSDEVAAGYQLTIALPNSDPAKAIIDYAAPNFLGLRTDDALYCFFGRNAFGAPVGASIHHFGEGTDQEKLQKSLGDWLTGIYA